LIFFVLINVLFGCRKKSFFSLRFNRNYFILSKWLLILFFTFVLLSFFISLVLFCFFINKSDACKNAKRNCLLKQWEISKNIQALQKEQKIQQIKLELELEKEKKNLFFFFSILFSYPFCLIFL